MGATLIVIFWLTSMLFLVIGVWGFCITKEPQKRLTTFMLATAAFIFVVLITFFYVPVKMPSGLPKISIDSGTYKVVFVYVAGGNVNLGIEQKEGENEGFRLYQFPMSAFDNNAVETYGTELLVVESYGFKKLLLK